MEIIAVINYKGGVGKTTVTSNLAAELAFRGKKVLVLDTDAQASLTFSFVTPDFWADNLAKTQTIKSWFDAIVDGKEPPSLTHFIHSPSAVNRLVRGGGGRLDLICSNLGLLDIDLELATLLGGASMQQNKKNYIKVHGQLRRAILALAEESSYDVVLIDCPPNFNIVTKNAVVAAEKILIPAKPDYLSTLGIDYLKKSVDNLVESYNEFSVADDEGDFISPQILGVVFTMIQCSGGQPITAQRQYMSTVRRSNDVAVFSSFFRENKTLFAEAPEHSVPVIVTKHSSDTHIQVVHEMEQFVDEFEKALEVAEDE